MTGISISTVSAERMNEACRSGFRTDACHKRRHSCLLHMDYGYQWMMAGQCRYNHNLRRAMMRVRRIRAPMRPRVRGFRCQCIRSRRRWPRALRRPLLALPGLCRDTHPAASSRDCRIPYAGAWHVSSRPCPVNVMTFRHNF